MEEKEKNFGFLGHSFQEALIKTIIEDRKYGETIIDVIESKYFDNQSFKFIIQNIKEYYAAYERIPDYINIQQKIVAEYGNIESTKKNLDTLDVIKNNTQDASYVKDRALNFCKQQNLRKELKLVQNIIDNGEFEEYIKIEEIIQKAMQVGLHGEDATDIFHDIAGALEKDHRHPIPTGIVGIDNLLKQGLGRGELGVVLAPTGTGKTTILTKFANTAFNYGFNVLQIFFEDNLSNIKRKHYTIWTNVAPDDQVQNPIEIEEKVKEAQSRSKGALKLLKLPSDSLTISELKSRIRKMNSDGFKLDLLVLDYVDCISPEKSAYGEEWKGEGSIMRGLEAMTTEFNIAIWTATQGNRESISSDVVTADQMGGSIKKAQIGHVILSIAKTLEQKENNLATLCLLKSRIGKDGIPFPNCKFNNEYLTIDTESQTTLLGMQEDKEEEKRQRAAQVYRNRQQQNNLN